MGKIFLSLIIILLSALPVLCQYTPGAGFTGSPHDFSTAAGNTTTVGACTFCHTPHRAIQTKLLWNHKLSVNTFNWSDTQKTAGGTQLASIASTWKGPTKFCLSCHDGSVAIGDVAWFNKQAWTGAGNEINNTKHDVDIFNIANGADLRGNHPVAHPYPNYQGQPSTYNGRASSAGVYVADFNTDPTTYGIRLFNDDNGEVTAGAVIGKTGIECTSCHAVHNERNLAQDRPLLRGRLTGNTSSADGYICMKCHTR